MGLLVVADQTDRDATKNFGLGRKRRANHAGGSPPAPEKSSPPPYAHRRARATSLQLNQPCDHYLLDEFAKRQKSW